MNFLNFLLALLPKDTATAQQPPSAGTQFLVLLDGVQVVRDGVPVTQTGV